MFVICYTYGNGVNEWEIADGKEEMQKRFRELVDIHNIAEEDIMVFDIDTMLCY